MFSRKRVGDELAKGPRQPAIHAFIASELNRLAVVADSFGTDALAREQVA